MTEEEVFETTEDAYKAIQGIYAALSHNRIYGLQTSTYYGCNNDIEFATTNAVPEDTRRGLWDYTATSSNTEIEGFIYMYIAINRANECIAGIEKVSCLLNQPLISQVQYAIYMVKPWHYAH